MNKRNRDFDYMHRKQLEEQDVAYNVRFERDRKVALERMISRRPNHWGDKFASDMRHLASLGIIQWP